MSHHRPLLTLREVYISHIERLRKDDKPLLEHSCPHCTQTVITQRPGAGEIWDSMRSCPYCDGMYFYVAYGESGHVDAVAMDFSK